MAELKNYVEGQPIEPSRPIVYTTIEERAELKAYREFGNLSQLRVLCDNYYELIDELRSRPTESEIRASIIETLKNSFRWHYESARKNGIEDSINWADYFDLVAEQLKGE